MTPEEEVLARKITLEIALAVATGEGDMFRPMLETYGTYGLDLVEKYCQEQMEYAKKSPGTTSVTGPR